MKNTLLVLMLMCVFSCTNHSNEEYRSLEKEQARLEAENNQLRTEVAGLEEQLAGYQKSPTKLLANAKSLFSTNDVSGLLEILNDLQKYHPESVESKQVNDMYTKSKAEVERKELEAKRKLLAEKEAAQKKRMMAVNKLKKNHDDVSDITWYQNPYFTHHNNSNLTSIYIGKRETSLWLRLMMSYYGDSWIFFENAFLSYDGNTIEVPFNKYNDKKTDNNSETWEWIDVQVNSELHDFLKEMVKGKDIKMRLSGKYTKTRKLGSSEVNGIKDVLLAYDVLKNGGN